MENAVIVFLVIIIIVILLPFGKSKKVDKVDIEEYESLQEEYEALEDKYNTLWCNAEESAGYIWQAQCYFTGEESVSKSEAIEYLDKAQQLLWDGMK